MPGPGRDERLLVHPRGRVNLVRAVPEPFGSERRASEGSDKEEDDEDPAGDGDLVLAEPPPDLLPVPAGLDCMHALAELASTLERDLGGQTCAGRENFASVLGRHRTVEA